MNLLQKTSEFTGALGKKPRETGSKSGREPRKSRWQQDRQTEGSACWDANMEAATVKSPLNPPCITASLRIQNPEKENFMSELGSRTHMLVSKSKKGCLALLPLPQRGSCLLPRLTQWRTHSKYEQGRISPKVTVTLLETALN